MKDIDVAPQGADGHADAVDAPHPQATPPGASDGPVARRRVYYVAGFDTRGPRFYHQLYRDGAAQQQQINGCDYEVGELVAGKAHSSHFSIRSDGPAGRVDTIYTFLQWNDIIRTHWPASSLRVAASIPAFYGHYARHGCLERTRALSKPFYWMILLPLLYTLVGAVLAVLAGLGTAMIARGGGLSGPAIGLAGAAAGLALLAGTLVLSERQRVFWLMRAWTFMLEWARRPAPLEARWSGFAQQIDEELVDDPVDEVLIVGHSAGAMAAISLASHWLERAPTSGPRTGRVKLMTIGSATPLLGLIPEAGWFREHIARVGASAMPWMEYTAPADPLCYALVDPFTACGLAPVRRAGYRIKSARFDKMFDASKYRHIRRDFFKIHFQYMQATDHPVDNDYFSLTAGPRPLAVMASEART